MFERRLKLFLLILAISTVGLLVRAMHVQIISGDYWRSRAIDSMKRSATSDFTRGRILSYDDQVLATDEPSTDAAVDYRAIIRDEAWIKTLALERARATEKYRKSGKDDRAKLLADEIKQVNDDLDRMWEHLASVADKSLEEIEQIKAGIRQRVEMRRRYLWMRNYETAVERHRGHEPDPWYSQWLVSGDGAPQIDSFAITVQEETQAHVILRGIDDGTYITLGKELRHCPGLELRHTKRRYYPMQDLAAHVIGWMSGVSREDLERDPEADNELRKYLPNDAIGRYGIEAMCEAALRGTRGRIDRQSGREDPTSVVEAKPGRDVRTTIDARFQSAIQKTFARCVIRDHKQQVEETREDMHGAAVVIDVKTGQVRAMVSYPTFDLNQLDQLYPQLALDDLNKPLLNRATQYACEPGSTMKLVVALGGLADGTITPSSTTECTGYLVLNGVKYLTGRCWLARQFSHLHINVAHHKQPDSDPHPTGFLTVTDAIQRSCNVFFETLGDQMGLDRLSHWMRQLGLGRKTGVGLLEVAGRVPDPNHIPRANLRASSWYASIGQGPVAATPLQMANVAATIARDGIWMRPTLVVDEDDVRAPATMPSRVDLCLQKEHIKAVKDGMYKVVNTGAGTGLQVLWLLREDFPVKIAGKTGSAQTGMLRVPERDHEGKIIYEEIPRHDARGNVTGTVRRIKWHEIQPNAYSWYQGTGPERKDLSHAWFVGYAPADNPQIAFCVFVEYGGGGGKIAGAVAAQLLEAAAKQGYLAP